MDGLAARALLGHSRRGPDLRPRNGDGASGQHRGDRRDGRRADAAVVTTGQSLGFTPLPGREQQAYARLIGAPRSLRLLAQGGSRAAVALRQPSARAADRLPDARGLGRGVARLAREAAGRRDPRIARVRSGARRRCGRSSSPGGRRSGAGWSCRRSIASTSTRCSRRSSASSQAPTTAIRRRLRQHLRVERQDSVRSVSAARGSGLGARGSGLGTRTDSRS